MPRYKLQCITCKAPITLSLYKNSESLSDEFVAMEYATLADDSVVVECKRCYEGSPGSPRKTIRSCSKCGSNIVVMGVPGAVRLLCKDCGDLNPVLADVERLRRDRDRYHTKLCDLQEAGDNLPTVEELEAGLKESLEKKYSGIIAANDRVIASQDHAGKLLRQEILELKDKLSNHREYALADRIKAKLRMKYGDTEKKQLTDFVEWLIEEKGFSSFEGNQKLPVSTPDLVDTFVGKSGKDRK